MKKNGLYANGLNYLIIQNFSFANINMPSYTNYPSLELNIQIILPRIKTLQF